MDGVKTRPDKKRKSVTVQATCLPIEQFLGYKTNMLERSRWFCQVPFPSPDGIGTVMPATPSTQRLNSPASRVAMMGKQK